MPLPVLPLALAAGAALLLFGKKGAAAAQTSPSTYNPSPSPYAPPSDSGGGSSGGGGGYTPSPGGLPPYVAPTPTSPGVPGYDPSSGTAAFPDPYGQGGGQTPIGPAASSTGTNADTGFLSGLTDLFSSGAPMRVGAPAARQGVRGRFTWDGYGWVEG